MTERKRRTKKDLVVIPPESETTEGQLIRKTQVARHVGIQLMKFFESGEYKSPVQVKERIEEMSEEDGIGEVDLGFVCAYLLGALDQDDFDSPMHKAFNSYSFHNSSENVTRQALTTLGAVISEFETNTLSGNK